MVPTAEENKRALQVTVRRSRRRTLSIKVKDGRVVVYAPYYVPDEEIRNFLEKNTGWIRTQLLRQSEIRKNALPPLTKEELHELADRAMQVIPERVRYYAPLIGVTYGRITIRNQRTRWGSCSSKGNLNFNCLLMLTPPQVIDSVVVHELCHRKEMNHSDRFYAEVLRVFPDYREADRWLRENGKLILASVEE